MKLKGVFIDNTRYPARQELPAPPPGSIGWPWTEETRSLPKIIMGRHPRPKISIVTPSYNQGQFLEETIRSVLLQGYPDLEYIIMDGGSTDNSREIIEKYEQYLAGWMSEKDRGQAHALNKGFRLATGDILAWVNSDDMLLPGTLHCVAQEWIQDHRAFWITGGCKLIDAFRSEIGRRSKPPPPELARWIGSAAGSLSQQSTFWSREITERVGLVIEEYHCAFDREYWMRFLSKGYRYRYVKRRLAAFRLHSESKTTIAQRRFTSENTEINERYLKMLAPGCKKRAISQREKVLSHERLMQLDFKSAQAGRMVGMILLEYPSLFFKQTTLGWLRRYLLRCS